MRCTCSSRRIGWIALLLGGCTTALPPQFARPALPMPPAVAAHYALPGEVMLRASLQQQDRIDGSLVAGDERAEFHLLLPPGPPRPLVVLVPILAGGDALMQALAVRMLARGFAVGWCDRVASALRPPQRGPDLERLFRRTVVHQRMLLAWARSSGPVDGSHTFVLGVSLGGMVTAVLMAVEPEVEAAAMCLAGADLPDLILHSRENRVLHWRDFRRQVDGIGDFSVGAELRRDLVSDPLHLAPFVPTDKVLLVEAHFDDVVPPWNQMVLWEAFGRPRRFSLPLGHYSAALAINPILDAVGEFFRARLADAAAAATPQ